MSPPALGGSRLLTWTIGGPQPRAGCPWPTLEPFIAGRIDEALISTYWDDLLRLATSVRLGTTPASLMLRRLGSYPRQNGLALALREVGRIERTLFTLDWLDDPVLRRQATAELNKGKSRNALARAVCFTLADCAIEPSKANSTELAASISSSPPSSYGIQPTWSAPSATCGPEGRRSRTSSCPTMDPGLAAHQPHRRLYLDRIDRLYGEGFRPPTAPSILDPNRCS